MNEALNTLDQWKLEESQLDVIFYNTIIEQAWVQVVCSPPKNLNPWSPLLAELTVIIQI